MPPDQAHPAARNHVSRAITPARHQQRSHTVAGLDAGTPRREATRHHKPPGTSITHSHTDFDESLVRHHLPSLPAGPVVLQPARHLIRGEAAAQTGHHMAAQHRISVHLPGFWAASLLFRPRLRPVRPVLLLAAITGDLPAYHRLVTLDMGRNLLVRQADRQTARYLLTIFKRQRPTLFPHGPLHNHRVRRESQQRRSPTGRHLYLREDPALPNSPIAFTPCDQGPALARCLATAYVR